jgi:hypothetical protein
MAGIREKPEVMRRIGEINLGIREILLIPVFC